MMTKSMMMLINNIEIIVVFTVITVIVVQYEC